MPTNLYGPGDNYDLASSHVIAALLAKAHAAKQAGSKELVVWGSGEPLREFMYVDDLADALIFLIENYSGEEHVNIGVGSDVSIRNLAEIVMRVVGMQGQIRLDRSKPDGTPRKLMDSSRLLAMGWKAKTSLEEGLSVTYQAFLRETASVKVA
jgi:GDP-L-fucose synthase